MPLLAVPTAEEFFKAQFSIQCPRCRQFLDLKALIVRKDENGAPKIHRLPSEVYCVPCKDNEEDTSFHVDN